MTLSTLEFENYILDNVHGFIGLTKVENIIERLPIFQRLRRIKQLGLGNWIFPGAEHTRYSHSLGVMHIIDQMAIKLRFSPKERQLVRLAGMLHDIGHYPISHIGEYAYKSKKPVNPISFFQSNAKYMETAIGELGRYSILGNVQMSKPSNDFHHENIGTLVIKESSAIKKAIEDYAGCEIDINDICDIITGHLDRNQNLSAMVQLLHSELDADRIDYLLRDATASGTCYGNFELSALIKCLERRTHSKYGYEIVGVNAKGVGPAEQFLLSRSMAYSQVIQQKHVTVLGFMAEKVMAFLANSGKFTTLPTPDALKEWVDDHENSKYQNFTDQIFNDSLAEIGDGSGCAPEIFRLIKSLRKYQALELSKSSSIAVSGRGKKIVRHVLNNSLYNNLINEKYLSDNQRIGIFTNVCITGHVPLKSFELAYKMSQPDASLDDYLLQRLQNGVAFIPPEGDPELVIDQPYSIIKDLSQYNRVMIREYCLP